MLIVMDQEPVMPCSVSAKNAISCLNKPVMVGGRGYCCEIRIWTSVLAGLMDGETEFWITNKDLAWCCHNLCWRPREIPGWVSQILQIWRQVRWWQSMGEEGEEAHWGKTLQENMKIEFWPSCIWACAQVLRNQNLEYKSICVISMNDTWVFGFGWGYCWRMGRRELRTEPLVNTT